MSKSCPRGFKQLLGWLDGQIESFERLDAEVRAWMANGEALTSQIPETLRILRASRNELLEAIEVDLHPSCDQSDDGAPID